MKKQLFPLMLALLLLVACVPTPDEEAVVNRLDGKLEQAIIEGPVEPCRYDAPARWDETVKIRKQEVRFAADIEVPTAEAFPVETVRQRTITAEDVLSFLQKFCPGEWTIRENEYSREELMEDLKRASNMYLGVNDDTGEAIWGANEEEMKRIQALIDKVPTEDTYLELNAKTLNPPFLKKPVKNSKGEIWYLSVKDKSENSFIMLFRSRNVNTLSETWVMQDRDDPFYHENGLQNIKISEEDALKIGDKTVAALGFSDFRAAEALKVLFTQSYTLAEYGQGYQLNYVPMLDGTVPCFYSERSTPSFINFADDPGATFAPLWRQEYIQMDVTEEGIQSLCWIQPKEHLLVANANVRLMPFEEFQKTFKQLLGFAVGDYEDSPILVQRLVLTTAIAQIPNQGDEAFLIPAWAVFMTTEDDQEAHSDVCVMLINAIDGTFINNSPQNWYPGQQ